MLEQKLIELVRNSNTILEDIRDNIDKAKTQNNENNNEKLKLLDEFNDYAMVIQKKYENA